MCYEDSEVEPARPNLLGDGGVCLYFINTDSFAAGMSNDRPLYPIVSTKELILKIINKCFLVAAIVAVTTTGCASYRTDSNISSNSVSPAKPSTKILISEGVIPNKKYAEIGSIEVSVKKLTVFHNDPTKEQANEALIEKAIAIGADAVINVTYKTGIGLTTWGYIDANGTGVKFSE